MTAAVDTSCALSVTALLYDQGERGHAFYIVESGQLSAYKDNSPVPVLSYGPGEYSEPVVM